MEVSSSVRRNFVPIRLVLMVAFCGLSFLPWGMALRDNGFGQLIPGDPDDTRKESGRSRNSQDAEDQSRMDQCWHLYNQAVDYYGDHVLDRDVTLSCLTLRTYLKCILESNAGPSVGLWSTQTILRERMNKQNCSRDGPVFKGSVKKPKYCSYLGKKDFMYCSLFGDPHIRTFSGEYQTCKALGAWPLVDNNFLTVLVTNEPVLRRAQATAITKVTVIIKANDDCAGHDYETYEATAADPLPAVMSHGEPSLGPARSVRVDLSDDGVQARLRLPYAATLVEIRQVSGYLSVGIRLPSGVVNSTLAQVEANSGAKQPRQAATLLLCHHGCPSPERIDTGRWLATRASGAASQGLPMTRDTAESRCRAEHDVTGTFYDACVFDLLTTNDVNFTQAAAFARADTKRLLPRAAELHDKRRTLDVHDNALLLNNLVNKGEEERTEPVNGAVKVGSGWWGVVVLWTLLWSRAGLGRGLR